MALTNTQLETMYNLLSDRIALLERQVSNSVSIAQLNGITLLLEREVESVKDDLVTMGSRMDTAEEKLEDLV
jgi:hypothetical protein